MRARTACGTIILMERSTGAGPRGCPRSFPQSCPPILWESTYDWLHKLYVVPAMLPLLHLDEELVAIDKPAGLLVHPSALDAHEERSALKLLRDQLGERLWPLHRLDKGTSGVLVFARNADAARRWGIAFDDARVSKRYLALVRGWPGERGVVDQPLARDPELPSAGQQRLAAVTRYTRLACFDWPFRVDGRHPSSRYALVQAEPLTGRRHQIRRHFKHIAHPPVGDTTHGKGAHNRAVAQWLGVSRLWLHALSLELRDGDRVLRIDAPCGAEWQPLLAAAQQPVAEQHA
jgi:tRNA pseudouridine65 synthase